MHFFVLFILCLVSAVFNSAQSQSLFGTWEAFEKKESIILILNKNGTGSFDGIAFTYKVEENEIIATFDYGIFNYDYELKGTQLLLKEGNLEHPYNFKKIKDESNGPSQVKSNKIDEQLLGTWFNNLHKLTFFANGNMELDGQKLIYEVSDQKLKVFSGNQMEESPYSVSSELISIMIKGEIQQLKKQK